MTIYLTCGDCGKNFTECWDIRSGESVLIDQEIFDNAICNDCRKKLHIKDNGIFSDDPDLTFLDNNEWKLEESSSENDDDQSNDEWMNYYGYDGMNY